MIWSNAGFLLPHLRKMLMKPLLEKKKSLNVFFLFYVSVRKFCQPWSQNLIYYNLTDLS